MDYFDKLTELMTPIFSQEPYNVTLNFKGLPEIINDYTKIDITTCELHELINLTKTLNSWTNYIGDILSLSKKVMLDSDVKTKQLTADFSVKYDKFNAISGERLAIREPQVVNQKLDYDTAYAFVSLLENKKSFLERAYYHCKVIYEIRSKITPVNI